MLKIAYIFLFRTEMKKFVQIPKNKRVFPSLIKIDLNIFYFFIFALRKFDHVSMGIA